MRTVLRNFPVPAYLLMHPLATSLAQQFFPPFPRHDSRRARARARASRMKFGVTHRLGLESRGSVASSRISIMSRRLPEAARPTFSLGSRRAPGIARPPVCRSGIRIIRRDTNASSRARSTIETLRAPNSPRVAARAS